MADTYPLNRYWWSISWIVTAIGSLLVVFFVFDTSRGYDKRQLELFDAAAMVTPCHELPQVPDSVSCWFREATSREDFEAILADIRAAIEETRERSGDVGRLVEMEYALVQRLQRRIAQHDATMNLWLTSWALFTTACMGIIVLAWLSYMPDIYRHAHRRKRFSLLFIGVPFSTASVLILASLYAERNTGQVWLLGLLAASFVSVVFYHYLHRGDEDDKHGALHAVFVTVVLASAVGVALYYLEPPRPVWLYLFLFAVVFLSALLYYRNFESNTWAPLSFGLLWIAGGITVSWATSSDWFLYPSLGQIESISYPDVKGLVSFHSVVRDAAVSLIIGFILLLTWPFERQGRIKPSATFRVEKTDPLWAIQYIQRTDELDHRLKILRERMVGLRGVLYAGAIMIGLGLVEIGFFYDIYRTRDPEYAMVIDELGRASQASVGAIFSLLLAGGYLLAALPLSRRLDEIRKQVITPTTDFPGLQPREWNAVVEHYQLEWARNLFSLPRLTILSSPALIGLTDELMRSLLGM